MCSFLKIIIKPPKRESQSGMFPMEKPPISAAKQLQSKLRECLNSSRRITGEWLFCKNFIHTISLFLTAVKIVIKVISTKGKRLFFARKRHKISEIDKKWHKLLLFFQSTFYPNKQFLWKKQRNLLLRYPFLAKLQSISNQKQLPLQFIREKQ